MRKMHFGGWDLPVPTMILSYSNMERVMTGLNPALNVSHSLSCDDLADTPLGALSDEELQRLLVTVRDSHGSVSLSQLLLQFKLPDQLHMLGLLSHDLSHDLSPRILHVDYKGSVLDSGSSKHLHPRTHVTNSDDCISLTGFNNSTEWTQGNGYLPLQLYDENSNTTVSADITDADKLDVVASPVLSMGKMLLDGYKFIFESPTDLWAYAPGGAHKYRVDLGDDAILRLPHEIRTGKQSRPLPSVPSMLVGESDAPKADAQVYRVTSRALQTANGMAFHDIFQHGSMEKVYQTLLHTTGYKACRFPDFICTTCAKIKAVRKGLSNKKHDCSLASDANGSHSCNHVTLEDVYVLLSEYDDDDHDDGDEPESVDGIEYISPVAGRSLGIQPVPRFDLEKIRPFEVIFCDNKDYDVPVRGGRQVAFLVYDYKTTAKFKVDLFSKKDNGRALREIVALNGIHKLPYQCHVYSDGCGSMAHVELAAVLLGLDHSYIPPHEQSLNEAEKICNVSWAAAEAHLEHSNAPHSLLALAVSYVLYVDLRTATTPSRGYLTPYEMIKGDPPSILKLHRFYTRAFVTAPKQKRKQLMKKGILGRAEEGRFLGFQAPYSSTYRVLLTGNRLVHSINVTFDDSNYREVADAPMQSPPKDGADVQFPMSAPNVARGVQSEEANTFNPNDLPYGFKQPTVRIEHCDLFDKLPQPSPPTPLPEFFDPDDDAWKTHADSPQARPRPSYNFLCSVENAVMQIELSPAEADSSISNALQLLVDASSDVDYGAILDATRYLAMSAQKDMSWKKALAGPDRDNAIAALTAEKDSLLSTILEPITSDHPDYQRAVKEAISGRYLLDVKRNGTWKARGVKQGFKEDKATADGPGFQYYSHVAKFVSVRMAIFRPNRGTRRLLIKDVSTAFLQSKKFPLDLVKFICFYDPLLRQWEYFRQTGPIYGECSAPVRWEDTYAEVYDENGYTRGDNEPAAFYNEDTDTLALSFVDDGLCDAEEDQCVSWSALLESNFECKEDEWVVPDAPAIDYLGMLLRQTRLRMFLSMEAYIFIALENLGWSDVKVVSTPIAAQIDTESAPLSPSDQRLYMTATGCLGWLANTTRPDVAYAHSRISQHMASPNESALKTVKRSFAYLKGCADLALSALLNGTDLDVTNRSIFEHDPVAQGKTQANSSAGWEFYVDSDFAGNTEVQNKRRSQNGYIALLNGAPVLWGSKASSVAFAHPQINEAHADSSSSAAEIYAAANATYEFLHLSYIAEEIGLDFPLPFALQMDNAAAKIFAEGSAFKTKLKHIDCRQEWVKTLRDRNICVPVHVTSKNNLADLFTKILPVHDFQRLRDRIMYDPKSM